MSKTFKIMALAVLATFILACGFSSPSMPTPTAFVPTLPTVLPTVTEQPTQMLTMPTFVTVSGDWNCRASPSTNGEVIAVVHDGDMVELTDFTNQGWTLVRPLGMTGLCWIAGW